MMRPFSSLTLSLRGYASTSSNKDEKKEGIDPFKYQEAFHFTSLSISMSSSPLWKLFLN